MTHPYLKIVAKNTFTLFNFVNVILAVMVALVGSYKNMLFIFIALANTLISIVNGVRAQRTIDKLKLLSEKRPIILKNNKPTETDPSAIQKGDTLVLTLGDQITYDSVVEDGDIEVNEAFITGEQENIKKKKGDHLTSGSFIVAGSCTAKVEHVGDDNFVTKLNREASTIKNESSKLFKLMNNIVKYISYALIPIGALLLWARFRTEPDTTTAVTSTVAALINMIPEGLILLTSSVLALATIRLSRKKVLVQDLYAIETLARVDTICLDKTGTLTTGKMTVKDFILPDGTAHDTTTKSPTPAEKSFLSALNAILTSQTAENATISVLKQKFLKTTKFKATDDFTKITDKIAEVIPFSSDRKYSGIKTKDATYLMGAIEFITDDKALIKKVKQASAGYRTLAIVRQSEVVISKHCAPTKSAAVEFEDAENDLLEGIRSAAARGRAPAARGDGPAGRGPREVISASSQLLGIIRLKDEIRPTAPKIINYFYDNDIAIKIISGDDLTAVTEIAAKVGVRDLNGIDLSSEKSHNYTALVKNYSIFTRVTPSEKKELIRALKKQGHTVAMTGDGVNDILAMKEADASISIGEGSDAARRASKFVLLNSGFEAVPSIIDEGRQSINNLERSTSLFLAKTVYASLLAVLFVILPLAYPFTPIEMSLLNFACIGFPGLILALEKNTARPKNLFIKNIKTYSVPTGLTVTVAMLALSTTASILDFSHQELNTSAIIITFIIDLTLIYWISRPLNFLRAALIVLIIGIFLGALFIPLAKGFFEFTTLTPPATITTTAITTSAILVFIIIRLILTKTLHHRLK